MIIITKDDEDTISEQGIPIEVIPALKTTLLFLTKGQAMLQIGLVGKVVKKTLK